MQFNHALIIEDDEFMQDLLHEYLNILDIPQVTSSPNGQHALNVISNHKDTPDLLLLDINLPILDGYQVIDQLSSTNYQGKIILISGSNRNILSSAQLLARWSNLQVGNYLIKPFTKDTLIHSILN